MLAAVGAGLYGTLTEASVMRGQVRRFSPMMDDAERKVRLAGWKDALERVLR